MSKTIVGIEQGTSYSIINGTRSFTITGLAGKLTSKSCIRSVQLVRSGAKTTILAYAIDSDNLFTLIENSGIYTIDYSAYTDSQLLLSTDSLVIDYVADSGFKTIIDSINNITNSFDRYESTVTRIISCQYTIKHKCVITKFTNVQNVVKNGTISCIVGDLLEAGDYITVTPLAVGIVAVDCRLVGIVTSFEKTVEIEKTIDILSPINPFYDPDNNNFVFGSSNAATSLVNTNKQLIISYNGLNFSISILGSDYRKQSIKNNGYLWNLANNLLCRTNYTGVQSINTGVNMRQLVKYGNYIIGCYTDGVKIYDTINFTTSTISITLSTNVYVITNGNYIYLVDLYTNGKLYLVNIINNTLTIKLTVTAGRYNDAEFVDNKILICPYNYTNFLVYNPVTEQQESSITVTSSLNYAPLSDDNYIYSIASTRIIAINKSTLVPTYITLSSGNSYFQGFKRSNGNVMYLSDSYLSELSNGAIIRQIPVVGRLMDYNPVDDIVCITNSGTNKVYLIKL